MPITPFFWRHDRFVWLLYLGLVLILSGLYFGSLADLELDTHDLETFRDNVALSQDFWHLFSPNRNLASGRLVSEVVKWLAYCVWGNEAASFHLLVVALHTLASLLLARLVRLLGHSLPLSLATGLLFLVNTAHFRAVHWISALDYPLAFCWAVGAMLCYMHHLSSLRPGWLGGFYGCLFIGTLSHLSCLAILPVCIYWTWHQGIALRRGLLHFLPALLLLLPATLTSLYLTGKSASTWSALFNYPALHWLEVPVQISGILLWLLGRLYTTAHWLPFSVYELHRWELYAGGLFLLPHLVLIWRRHVPGALWTVWMVSALLPFAFLTWDILLTSMPVGPSRYLYMATAGSSALLAWGLQELAGWVARWLGLRDLYAYAVLLVLLLVSSYFSLKRAEALSLYSSGRSYIAEEEVDLGIVQIQRALEHAPDILDLEDAYRRLCLMLIGRGDKFVRAVEEGLTVLPNDAQLSLYRYAYESMAADSSSRRQAQHYLEKAEYYAAEQEDVAASLALGRAFYNLALGFQRTQDFEQTAIAYRRALEYLPSHTNSLIGLAYSLFALNRVEEAGKVTRQIVQIEPLDPRVLYLVALSHQTEGKAAEVLALSREALRLGPSVELYYLMSTLYHQLGQFDLAAITLEEGVRRKGKNITPVTYERLGNYYRKSKRFDQALDVYRAALDLAPAKLELYTQISSILRTHKGREAALQFYLEVLQKPEQESDVYAQIGLLLNEVGARDDAIGALRQALARDAGNADARTNLAWLLYLDGKVEEAIEQTRRVLDEEADSDAVFNLGLFYLHRGEVDKARQIYVRAVRQFGAATAVEIGATDDLKELIDRGIQVRAAGEILKAHWDL